MRSSERWWALMAVLALVPYPTARADSTPPPAALSVELRNGIRAYEDEDFTYAKGEFEKVVAGKTIEDPPGVMRARFFLGKTLYKLKDDVGAIAQFRRIVDAGPKEHYRYKSLQWLVALSRRSSGAAAYAVIARYSDLELAQPELSEVSDALNFGLGCYLLSHGDPARGRRLHAKTGGRAGMSARVKRRF